MLGPCFHIETSRLIYTADKLACTKMMGTLTLDVLSSTLNLIINPLYPRFSLRLPVNRANRSKKFSRNIEML